MRKKKRLIRRAKLILSNRAALNRFNLLRAAGVKAAKIILAANHIPVDPNAKHETLWSLILTIRPDLRTLHRQIGFIRLAVDAAEIPNAWILAREFLEPGAHQVRQLPEPRSVTPANADYLASKEFLLSYEWRRLRMQTITKYGARCMCCGARPSDGVRMQVDHIKPRKKYPELALEPTNLQVLCEECNHGKGNWSEKDWRSTHQGEVRDEQERKAQLH